MLKRIGKAGGLEYAWAPGTGVLFARTPKGKWSSGLVNAWGRTFTEQEAREHVAAEAGH